MSSMDPRYPEGMMFDNEKTELEPDPDDRTDKDMEGMYGDEIRESEKFNIGAFVKELATDLNKFYTKLSSKSL